MKSIIEEKLFKTSESVKWFSARETFEISRDGGSANLTILVPNHNAILLLARYYELKYGVKIIVLNSTKDVERLIKLIQKSEQSSLPHKYGFILPSFFAGDTDLKANEFGHVCPVVYEKLSDKSSLISLDSVAMEMPVGKLHKMIIREIIEQSPKPKPTFYCGSTALQASNSGCRHYGVSVLKDALRLPNIVDRLGDITVDKQGDKTFAVFPGELLKYSQSARATAKADSTTEIIRSSKSKPPKTLAQHQAENKQVLYMRKTADRELGESSAVKGSVQPQEEWKRFSKNTKLLDKGDQSLQKIEKLCEFYGVTSERELEDLINKLQIAQNRIFKINDLAHLIQLPETLPTWSKIEDGHQEKNNEVKIEDVTVPSLSVSESSILNTSPITQNEIAEPSRPSAHPETTRSTSQDHPKRSVIRKLFSCILQSEKSTQIPR